jgi:hypothetical protein
MDGAGHKTYFVKVQVVYGLGVATSTPEVDVSSKPGNSTDVLRPAPASGGGAPRTVTVATPVLSGSVELTPHPDGSASVTGGGLSAGEGAGVFVTGKTIMAKGITTPVRASGTPVAGSTPACKEGESCK